MRALGASERVMAIISSAEVPPTADAMTCTNLEIAGGAPLPDRVAGRVVFKVRSGVGCVALATVEGSKGDAVYQVTTYAPVSG